MEIVKIATIVEIIRQKRQRNAQISGAIENIQKIIEKKRLKRSSHESVVTTNSWHDREKKSFASNKRARYPKSYYRDQGRTSLPTRKRAIDLKVASNIAIPSTVFYKRIWEYINGTRPHSDIIGDYGFLQNNSAKEKNNLTCTDKNQITVSQSQRHKLQVINPNIKPERDFYKRIWDIINATQLTHGGTKARSKRNVNIPESNISTQLCVQEKKTDYAEDKRPQAINDKVTLDIAETIKSRKISDPYISGFTNKTQRQPKTTIPIVNTIKLNNDLILSPYINTASASEVADLNKFPDNVETNIDYLSSDNSTKYEKRNRSQKIITETRPPYSSQEQENSTISSSSSIEHTIDNTSEKEDQTKHTENYSINTTPIYDPSYIPYVEVPDYTDQQEDNLDKDNQNSTVGKYKEYDDVDFERHYNPDEEFSSKSPNAEIKVLQNIQTGNNVPEILLNVNISHSDCTENKDSSECIDKYDVRDTKLHDNNRETSGDVQRSKEDSVESNEGENSPIDFVDFDINEYKKPFNLDDFIKNDSTFESIQTNRSKGNAKYKDKNKNPADRSEGSEEFEIYATVPKEESYDYFRKNENHDDGIIFDDRDEAKKNTHSTAKEKAEDSDVISEDHYHYDDKDFLRHIFGENDDKVSSESIETEDKFLSRYFTKDVLDQLRDNSTAEEERQKEESRNKEEIYKTLSRILDKKDHFSRLDDNLDKMIKEGETIPIRYNNFWSLEYESPRKKNEASEETEI
ncbi:putative uncharacterized protein DDB_G0281733 [Polyergus mexicanus]|uniref:putative uncharacterized protein DDB_G0281733 n=1 Tax=Polyergus mexicanus TaxID=615972 RepID=UPI0038B56582